MADETIPQFKTCTKCGAEKPFPEFNRHGIGKDGRRPDCRACQKQRSRRYLENNREERRAAARRYARKAKAQRSAYNKAYYQKNKERVEQRNLAWKENNKTRWREIMLASTRKRQATPKGKLERAMRDGIRQEIRRGSKRGRRTFAVLGYTVDELKRQLERLFKPGMTWANYGEWHIDHKVPLSAFNYETPDDIDFKQAWALNNVQPLWAAENLKKHAKLERPFQPSLI